MEKLKLASIQMEDMLSDTIKGIRHCLALVDELSVLKTLTDPEKEINKRTARQGGPDGEGSRDVDYGEF